MSDEQKIGLLVLGARTGKKGLGLLVEQSTKNFSSPPITITIEPIDLFKECLESII